MKERLKKFFKDHEDTISIATFVSGTTAAIIGIHLLRKEGGHKIAGVFSGSDVPGGSTIIVTTKNGNVSSWTKPST